MIAPPPCFGMAAMLARVVVLVVAVWGASAVAASEIRVLARVSSLSPDLLARFERGTGIVVRLTEVADHASMVRHLAGGESGFDIAFPADHQVADLIAAGWLERIWADRLPGFWNIEDPWRSRSFDPLNEYTIPHQWGTVAFAVDTSVRRGDIDGLALLFDPPPELAGRIALLDDAAMVPLALLWLGESHCAVDAARLARVEAVLAPLVARSRLVPVNRVAAALRDDTLALVVAWSGDAMRARRTRPPLAYAYPREGNLVWTDVVAVPKRPPNRTNALKFLAFMLDPRIAALQSDHNGFATMIRGAETYMSADSLAAPEMVAPWPAKVGFMVSCGAQVQRQHGALWARLRSVSRSRRPG